MGSSGRGVLFGTPLAGENLQLASPQVCPSCSALPFQTILSIEQFKPQLDQVQQQVCCFGDGVLPFGQFPYLSILANNDNDRQMLGGRYLNHQAVFDSPRTSLHS